MKRQYLSITPIIVSLLIASTASSFATALSSNAPQSLQVASSLSYSQITQLAQTITVKVLSNEQLGSGILIRKYGKEGGLYDILTNAHVLNANGNYRIQTPDGMIYSAYVSARGNSLKGNDLAILQFLAKKNYRTVALTTTSSKTGNQKVYAVGFPLNSKKTLIITGRITLIAHKPLVGGYQIGYTNEIKRGMNGGALLNQVGELIGVNGLLNKAILNDTYTYLDGSTLSEELRPQLQKVNFAVPIQTSVQLEPSLAVPREPSPIRLVQRNKINADKIDAIAQQTTLRIDSKNNGNGSGLIMARQGQTYYVLTAYSVVEKLDQYTVITSDEERHPVKANDIVKEAGLDVAIIKFSSQKEYPVATLSRYNLSDSKSHWLFFSGFPSAEARKRKLTFGFRFGREQGLFQAKDTETQLSNSYELIFTNLSLPGMSGGPLLDAGGRVIGIGGRQEGEARATTAMQNLGYASAVPITRGLGLAAKVGIKPQWMKLETSEPPTLVPAEISSIYSHRLFAIEKPSPDANKNEWLNYGNFLWRLGKFEEAEAALKQAITFSSDFYQAYYVLGLVLQAQEKYPEALATFKQVTQFNSDYYQAWREQSNTLVKLEKYLEALGAIDRAIRINLQQVNEDTPILFINRSNILHNLKRYAEAEIALNQAIKIKPSSLAYAYRGLTRKELKNYPGAEADFTQAISINPDFALVYFFRGLTRKKLNNYPGAETDFTQAISINSKDANAYYYRGLTRKEIKKYSSAFADLQVAGRLFRTQYNEQMNQQIQQLLVELLYLSQ